MEQFGLAGRFYYSRLNDTGKKAYRLLLGGMNEQKKRIFEGTLTEAFDHDRYVQFLREFLDNMTIVAPHRESKKLSAATRQWVMPCVQVGAIFSSTFANGDLANLGNGEPTREARVGVQPMIAATSGTGVQKLMVGISAQCKATTVTSISGRMAALTDSTMPT